MAKQYEIEPKSNMKIIFASTLDNFYTNYAYNWLRYQKCEIIEFWNKIDSFPEDYDLGISFLYEHKIPETQLGKRWVNFHPAPLPKYRGRNVAYRAILNQEQKWGGTLHFIDKDFDTGPIIDIDLFDIDDKHTANDLINGSYQSLLNLFTKYIPKLLKEEDIIVTVQNPKEARYYKKSNIDDYIDLTYEQKLLIRALTAGNYYPKVQIGNTTFKIVKE